MKHNVKVSSICQYLVNPKGVALFPFPSDAPVANADVPEALSLQLPVVCPRGEGLDGEDLRPVVESFGVSGVGQALFDPRHGAQVIGDAQQRVGSVGVQGQRTGHWMREEQPPVKPRNRLEPTKKAQFDEFWH